MLFWAVQSYGIFPFKPSFSRLSASCCCDSRPDVRQSWQHASEVVAKKEGKNDPNLAVSGNNAISAENLSQWDIILMSGMQDSRVRAMENTLISQD
jgi:hypothetical protein